MKETRTLLMLGALAGPLYILVGLGQVLTREGFDPRRHALSQLAIGDSGWIQVANFLVCACLVIAGAIGVRRALRGSSGGTWGPILLAGYGIGLFGAGIFAADPGRGFPPGMPAPASMTREGLLHFVFGAIGFYSLIAACLVFALRFKRAGRKGWASYSLVTGLGFLGCFIAIASGPASPVVMLTFYAAVAWIWIWHSALMFKGVNAPPVRP